MAFAPEPDIPLGVDHKRRLSVPQLRYFGHSACEITDGDTRLLIDPFLAGNSHTTIAPDELNPTAILLTHAHNDHFGDTLAIAKRTGALVVCMFEIAEWLGQQGVEAHGMSTGGGYTFPWGWVKLTQAWHSSSYQDENGNQIAMGNPAGLLVRVGGKLLYHAGDTGLFGDMALIGRTGIDLALLPIGDNFTMGPDDALEAVKLLRPRAVVPVHYNTFPPIRQDPDAWVQRVEAETEARAVALKPGESLEY
jgi:L-ascorbate metabolism protein UlaG (beta-lactamase superfamily)